MTKNQYYRHEEVGTIVHVLYDSDAEGYQFKIVRTEPSGLETVQQNRQHPFLGFANWIAISEDYYDKIKCMYENAHYILRMYGLIT